MTLLLGFPIAYLMANPAAQRSRQPADDPGACCRSGRRLLVRTTVMDRAVAAAGRHQRYPCLRRASCRRPDRLGDMIHNEAGSVDRDDAHPAAVHGAAALFSVMKTIPPSYVRAATVAWRASDWTGVLEGLFPEHGAGHRRRCHPRFHPGDRLLHHAGTGRRHLRYLHLKPDRVSHFQNSLNWGSGGGAGRRFCWPWCSCSTCSTTRSWASTT